MRETPRDSSSEEIVAIIRRARAVPLTPYDEEFLIEEIGDGEDVKVGGYCYIRCDFSAFDERLNGLGVTPEEINKRRFAQFEKALQEPSSTPTFGENMGRILLPRFDEYTREKLLAFRKNMRRMLHTCWRATNIAKIMLGPVTLKVIERIHSFRQYKSKAKDGRDVCVKPLSCCVGEAACAEYTLMTYYILKKLGVQSWVVVGAFSEDPEAVFRDRHTFLVLENGNYVFDPTHSALDANPVFGSTAPEQNWSLRVFKPETPLTPDSLSDMGTKGEFGKKITCTHLTEGYQVIYGSGAT